MKTKTYFIISTLLSFCLVSCDDSNNDDDDDSSDNPVVVQLEQYTPDQANWDTFYAKPLAVGNTSHDPDGVFWLSPESWKAATWDGTIYDPTTKTREDFASCLCPSGDQVRGIREVFYEHKPFEDNTNPTKAEVDEWHRIAINHVRALVGYTSEDRKIKKDHCLFARALWSDERKFTRMWDDAYPEGTCLGYTNQHCGATFIPSDSDQEPYLPKDHAFCSSGASAEGVWVHRANAFKLSRVILCNYHLIKLFSFF